MATIQKRGDRYRALIRKTGHRPVSKTLNAIVWMPLASRFRGNDTEKRERSGRPRVA